MFTCPENDIHSIYLDNELPENFVAEYEAHIASCPKCKAKLEQMKKTHEAFQYDSAEIKLDKEFLDQSFERLQSRMRYAKSVSEAEEPKTIMFPEARKYMPVAVAAAAVFALVLPLGFRSRDTSQDAVSVAQVQPIKRTTNFAIDQNHIMTETSNAGYPLRLVSEVSSVNYGEANFTLNSFTPTLDTAVTPVTQYKAKSVSSASKLLADDFFSPAFAHSQDTTLQVYMPSYVDISSLSE